MRTFFGPLAVACTVLVQGPAAAIAQDGRPTCPAEIETEQSLRAPVEGFEVADAGGKHFWSAITFYEGRPEKMVALKFDSEADSGDGSYELTWNFDPKTEYWIECLYDSTSIRLVKKLPPVGECKVSTSAAQEMAMECR